MAVAQNRRDHGISAFEIRGATGVCIRDFVDVMFNAQKLLSWLTGFGECRAVQDFLYHPKPFRV